MKTKPTPFCDAMDRLFLLGNRYKGCVEPAQCNGRQFSKFVCGEVAHILVAKGDHIHIRFLPKLQTQWLFDSYGF